MADDGIVYSPAKAAGMKAAEATGATRTQGTKVSIPLYEAGDDFSYTLRGSSVSALTGYSIINSTLYAKNSSGTYTALSYSKFYVNGTVSTLYKSGSTVRGTMLGDEYTGDLYMQGTYYSGGLYSDFEPAEITTRNVTALTV